MSSHFKRFPVGGKQNSHLQGPSAQMDLNKHTEIIRSVNLANENKHIALSPVYPKRKYKVVSDK